MTRVKRKTAHRFVDKDAKKRQQQQYGEYLVKPTREWPDGYSAEEAAALLTTANKVLNGDTGIDRQPVSSRQIVE